MSKHRMIKLGGRCTVQKSWPTSNVRVIAPWVRTPQNVAVGYDVGKISAVCLVEALLTTDVSLWCGTVSKSNGGSAVQCCGA